MPNSNDDDERTGDIVVARYVPSRAESVAFDPTSVGLPADFVLTDHSDLKG